MLIVKLNDGHEVAFVTQYRLPICDPDPKGLTPTENMNTAISDLSDKFHMCLVHQITGEEHSPVRT